MARAIAKNNDENLHNVTTALNGIDTENAGQTEKPKAEKTVIASMRLPKAQKLEMDGYFHANGLNFSEGIFKFAYYAYTLAKSGKLAINENGDIQEV